MLSIVTTVTRLRNRGAWSTLWTGGRITVNGSLGVGLREKTQRRHWEKSLYRISFVLVSK